MVKKHGWFSGIITACHAVDPGSIPGPCNFVHKCFSFSPLCSCHCLHNAYPPFPHPWLGPGESEVGRLSILVAPVVISYFQFQFQFRAHIIPYCYIYGQEPCSPLLQASTEVHQLSGMQDSGPTSLPPWNID